MSNKNVSYSDQQIVQLEGRIRLLDSDNEKWKTLAEERLQHVNDRRKLLPSAPAHEQNLASQPPHENNDQPSDSSSKKRCWQRKQLFFAGCL